MTYSVPEEEQARLAALGQFIVTDSGTQQRLERVTRLAAGMFGVSTVAISFVAEHVTWCKVCHGQILPAHPREQSFCTHTIAEGGFFTVPDAQENAAFRDLPFVRAPFGFRFYAGVPIRSPDRHAVGCLAIYDERPRLLDADQQRMLAELAEMASELLALDPLAISVPKIEPSLPIAGEPLYEAIEAGVAILDAEGRFLFVNQAFGRLHRYDISELIDRSFGEILPRESREQFLKLNAAFFTGAPLPSSAIRSRRRDGEILDLTVQDRLVTLSDERKLRVMTVLKVADEEQPETRRGLREDQYRHVVNSARDIIFQTDDVGRWIFLNRAWETTTGFSIEDSIGKSIFLFLHPDDREPAQRAFARFIDAAEKHFHAEWRLLTTSSGFRWIEIQAELWTDPHGATLGAMGLVYDVTSRKEAQESSRRIEKAQDAIASVADLVLHYGSEEGSRHVEGALAAIGVHVLADRAYLVRIDRRNNSHRMLYEWCNSHVESHLINFRELPADIMPWLAGRLPDESPIVINDVYDLPDVAANERRIYRAKQVRAVVAVPLVFAGEVWGYLACERRRRTEWSHDALRVLKVCGEIVLGALQIKDLSQRGRLLERVYRIVSEGISDLLVVMKPGGTVRYVSPSLERALGVPSAALDKSQFFNLVLQEDRAAVLHAIEELSESDAQRTIRFRFAPFAEGADAVPVEAIISLRRDDDHGTTILLTARPVSAAYKVQEIIGRSERRFQEIVERAAEMALVINREGRISYANPGAERLLGTTVAGLIAQPFSEFIAREDLPEWRALLMEASRETGVPADGRIIRLITAGEQKACVLAATNLSLEPSVGGIVVLGVTLPALPTEKAADLPEAGALTRKSVMSFLANMSHEIRTPLSGILGFAGVLADELEGSHREFASMIEQSGKRLMETLNSVLDLARLESDRITLRYDKVDVLREAEEVVNMLRPLAAKKGIEVETRAEADAIYAQLDRAFLSRILNNLIGNAIKFTHSGGIYLSLSESKGDVLIEVRDTGIGMAEEYLSRLFEEFSQEGADLAHLFEGTGLGLAITRRLVNAMGGHIAVESRKGEGTTFTVRLPRGPQEARSLVIQDREQVLKPRILAVDDNRMTRLLIDRVLGRHYAVDTTETAEEALELAGKHDYDLVILDINLGKGLTGEQVLRELRKFPPYQRAPIMALTAYALPGDREHFLNAGFDYYLGKPFTRQELFDMVEQILASAPA